ncbi:D-inositol-3-phosphate glycosyltransferase [uncultured archaeon]|nr:D-inositol-3-phosphate glycosyltransferase [uncultured archaeon]
MKILYDHQIFASQIYGGVSRYFFELMKNFNKTRDIEFELSLRYSNNHYIENAEFSKHKSFFLPEKFIGQNKFCSFLNQNPSKKSLLKQDFDIFHPTYYDPYFLEHLGKKPFVLTIHDMIHELYPEMFSRKDNTSERKKLLLQKADKIIAISESTKRDILRFNNIEENKIKVIYHGNPLEKKNGSIALNMKLPDNFILYVGNRGGYKNFDFFLSSIIPLLKNDESLYVVCAGGGKFRGSENHRIKELNIKNKVLHYSIDNKILSCLYQKARVFVFPSLYEGFGIPVLESFSCGCPIALSNTSSLPEVAGNAALYFNPIDEFSIRETISKVIYNEEIRKELQSKGFEQLEKFSWEKTAKETAALYRELI